MYARSTYPHILDYIHGEGRGQCTMVQNPVGPSDGENGCDLGKTPLFASRSERTTARTTISQQQYSAQRIATVASMKLLPHDDPSYSASRQQSLGLLAVA